MTSRWLPGAFAATALIALAIAAGIAPTASAQTQTISLAATGPSELSALAPATLAFDFRASNSDPLLQRDIHFRVADAPANWTTSFDPASVRVPASGSASAKFNVVVKSGAAPGTYGFSIEALSSTTNFPVGNLLNFTVVVQAPAPAPTNPDPPTLAISVKHASVHGLPGASVTNMLFMTVTNAGLDGIRVQARGQGPSSWPPGSVSLNGDWAVYDTRSEPFTVSIPRDAVPGSLHTVRVTAESDAVPGGARTVSFTVEVDAPVVASEAPKDEPVEPAGNEPEATPAPAPTTAEGSASSEPTPTTSPLVLVLESTELKVEPGEYVMSAVQILNTGPDTIEVELGTTLAPEFEVTFAGGNRITIAPNSAREIRFSIVAPAGAEHDTSYRTLLFANDASEAFTLTIPEAPATVIGADEATVQESVAPAAAPPSVLDSLVATYGLTTVVAAGVAAGAAGAGALAFASSPGARRHAVWLAIGLYTRLTRPKLLDHPEREKLFQTIEANPGIHFHALQRELTWNTGALTYHLRVLERHQLVVSRRDGILRRFYLVGQAPRAMPVATAPVTGATVSLSGLRGNVLQTVRARGSIAQSALAEELGASKQTLNYHVKNLERLGLLRVERVGRDTFLSPAGDGLASEGAARPPIAYADGGFTRSDEFR